MSEPQVRELETLLFRDSSSSLASSAATTTTSNETATVYTTTSGKTYPGIGSLSGRYIHRLGQAILHSVEAVVVIRRRLSYIQSLCPLLDNIPPQGVELIYDDLLELSR